MSEVEKLETQYRSLATKLIYAGFERKLGLDELAELERLGEQIATLNAADFSKKETPELAAA